MKEAILIVIIILFLWYKSTTDVTLKCTELDGRCYEVFNKFDNSESASDMLARINLFNTKFLRLARVYVWNAQQPWDKSHMLCYNLLMRYNPTAIRENIPNGTNNTSYVMNKGEEIGFCLRDAEDRQVLISDDILRFVCLHEITHLAMDDYNTGHDRDYWRCFKIIMQLAYDFGIYQPQNYKLNPVEYCGLTIDYNPFFDDSL